MKKQVISFLTALLLVLLAAFLTGSVSAKADDLDPVDASSGVDLYTLSQNGYLKLTGRAIPNSEGYLETDFASSGFETIINAPAATDLVLTVSSYPQGLYKGRVTIYVDESEYTFVTNQGLGVTVTVPVPAGQHTIRAIKEAIIEYSVNDFTRMDRIQFNGTILGPAPEKPLYIVYIGASSQCGAHADVLYYPGTIGGSKNHYVTKSACFKLAELLNADINVVAKGGIGLMMTGVQELIGDGAVTMQNLYPYSGYRTRALGIPYDFTKERKPDMIVIGISGNDSNSEAECATSSCS